MIKYVILLLLFLPGVYAYEFTEIMYDPEGSDSNREWVEVVGAPLEGLRFSEGGSLHGLLRIQGNCDQHCVSIIADDTSQFLLEYSVGSNVLVYDSSWSSLKNSGEEVCLHNDISTITCYRYQALAPNGLSEQLIDGEYVGAVPTPGEIPVHAVPEFGVIGAALILLGVGIKRLL